jgi:hypothetical protein
MRANGYIFKGKAYKFGCDQYGHKLIVKKRKKRKPTVSIAEVLAELKQMEYEGVNFY